MLTSFRTTFLFIRLIFVSYFIKMVSRIQVCLWSVFCNLRNFNICIQKHVWSCQLQLNILILAIVFACEPKTSLTVHRRQCLTGYIVVWIGSILNLILFSLYWTVGTTLFFTVPPSELRIHTLHNFIIFRFSIILFH